MLSLWSQDVKIVWISFIVSELNNLCNEYFRLPLIGFFYCNSIVHGDIKSLKSENLIKLSLSLSKCLNNYDIPYDFIPILFNNLVTSN